MVLSLSLDCHASIDGIRRTFSSVLGVDISVGKISSILTEASKRAESFDDSISLDSIRQGANDEIFQGNTPILTGIDVESTYVYLLAEAGDRSADTWQLFMEDRKEHGLELEVGISDGGTGLNTGIPKAFPDICIQPDVFHELRPVGAELSRLERKAEKLISQEAELEKRAHGIKPRKRRWNSFRRYTLKWRRQFMNMNCCGHCSAGLWKYSDSLDTRFRIHICLRTGSFLKWKPHSPDARNCMNRPKEYGEKSHRYCHLYPGLRKNWPGLPRRKGFHRKLLK